MTGRLSSYFIRMIVLKVAGKTVPVFLQSFSVLKLGHVGGHVGLGGSVGQKHADSFTRKQPGRETVT